MLRRSAQLGDQQERLDGVIDSFEQQLKTFPPRLAEIATKQQRIARSLDRLPGAQPADRARISVLCLRPDYAQPNDRAVSGANPRRGANNRQ